MKNFEILGQLTIDPKDWPKDDAKEWGMSTWRQDAPGSPHGSTETIYYKMFPGEVTREKVFNELRAEWVLSVPEVVSDIVGMVAEMRKWSDIGRVMLVKLEGEGKVTSHIDEGEYADFYNDRVHVVVEAGRWAFMQCGEEMLKDEVGNVFSFNHKLLHEAYNRNETPRIHLIIDGRKAPEGE